MVRALLLAALVLVTPQAQAGTWRPLTAERLAGSPSLSGATARAVRFSPDGRFLTYVKAKATNALRTDLWIYDIAKGAHRILADSDALSALLPPAEESEAERGRRERQRIRETGVIAYDWSDDSKSVVVPIGGEVFLVPVEGAAQRLVTGGGAKVDLRFAPGGRRLTYVRDGDLVLFDLDINRETVLAKGTPPISFGVAEFVAQEELGRSTGYWWSPDGRFLAYARVDEGPVPETPRADYGPDGPRLASQRYPFAGGPNALVSLLIRDMRTGATVTADAGLEADHYLARVDWRPDSSAALVQRLTRDQTRLDLLSVSPQTGAARVVTSESAPTWIDVNDDLRVLSDGRMIRGTARTGFKHFDLLSADGALIRALTDGPEDDGDVVGVDETTGTLVYEAWRQNALDRQVMALAYDDPAARPVALTRGPGLHGAVLAGDGRTWLHVSSSTERPPEVALMARDGALLTTVIDNTVDDAHPLAPYRGGLVTPVFGTIPAEDGTPLNYALWAPPGAAKAGHRLPAIINSYGGPGAQEVHHGWMGRQGLFRQWMVQRGYVVLTLDNRGTPHRGVAFAAPIKGRFGTVEVADQAAGARFLASLPYVDGHRIGIYGHSYGGFNTLMALTRAPGVFAAGVAVAPVTDWRLYDTAYTERYLGDPAQGTTYRDAGVFRDLDALSAPLLVMHGMADDNVFFDNSLRLVKALQDKGKPFELMVYPGQRHGIADKAAYAHMLNGIVDFFDRRLKPQPGAKTAPGPEGGAPQIARPAAAQ